MCNRLYRNPFKNRSHSMRQRAPHRACPVSEEFLTPPILLFAMSSCERQKSPQKSFATIDSKSASTATPDFYKISRARSPLFTMSSCIGEKPIQKPVTLYEAKSASQSMPGFRRVSEPADSTFRYVQLRTPEIPAKIIRNYRVKKRLYSHA